MLVRRFAAVLEGPRPHLLIEHLEGPTLRSLIRRDGALPAEQLLPLAAHVAAALHYMAGEGWVHLDVKPDNIVMGATARDRPSASPARSSARAGCAARSAPMPTWLPSSATRKATLARSGPPRTSGASAPPLFHAVCGEMPFPRAREDRHSADPLVRFPQLTEPPLPMSGELPRPLRELVSAMLAPRAEERPAPGDVVLALEPRVDALPRKLAFARRGTRIP